MASVTVEHLLQAAAERPVLAVWLAGAVVMLTILSAAALARPRTFAVVLDDAALGDRTDRWLLLGALIVVGAVGWPVTLAVAAAGVGWRR